MKPHAFLGGMILWVGGMTSGGAWAHDRSFRFEDVSARLPHDTSLSGTSSVDIDAIDVDGDDGAGFFCERRFTLHPRVYETLTAVEAGDVDGDGDLDVIFANAGPFQSGHGFLGGQNLYFMNNGRGLFIDRTEHHFPEVFDPSLDIALGDLNGNGKLDVAVANGDPGGAERLYFLRHRRH